MCACISGCARLRNWARNSRRPLLTLSQRSPLVIAEVEERRGGAEFLTLKKHRRAWRKQQQRAHGAIHPRVGEHVGAFAARRVRHLIVILQKGHEVPGLKVERRRAAALLLPFVPLALIEVAVLRGGDELLRRARDSPCNRLRCGPVIATSAL